MKTAMQESVIIVAGGKGLRAGGETPKQFQLIAGQPVLMHTIEAFYHYNHEIAIVVVLPEGFVDHWKELCREYSFSIPHNITVGGETRFHSVHNGLNLIPREGLVAIHDAARPIITKELIERCFAACSTERCGVIPVVRETASVRVLTEGGGSWMLDREKLRLVQTPQIFPSDALMDAYNATQYDTSFTDDASVAEKHGLPIRLVEGEEFNIKITTPFDFLIAEECLHELPK